MCEERITQPNYYSAVLNTIKNILKCCVLAAESHVSALNLGKPDSQRKALIPSDFGLQQMFIM
jgi:hypothetical protein